LTIATDQRRDVVTSFLLLVGIPLDRRGCLRQERPPPVRDRLDLCEDLRFLFRRKIRPPVGELVELALELGPELPVCSSCCIRRVAKSSRTPSMIHADTTMAVDTITVLMRKRPIGPRPESTAGEVGS
jgi:hypothetical protein